MNLQPLLKSLYPENSIQGQCFDFMHKLVDFPHVGTLLSTKIQSLNSFGIPISKLDTIKVGDVLLLNYPIFGHGAIVNYIVNNQLQLSESNFNLDLKVHHGRTIAFHDPNILGVFRGTALYQIPSPQFPIQIPVCLVMNNSTDLSNDQWLIKNWNSLLQHMANFQSWFWTYSGQRIELIIDYKITNFKTWDVEYTGDGLGSLKTARVKEAWLDANIIPLTTAKFVFFVTSPSDWKDTVFGNYSSIELGYAYETGKIPAKALIILDQFDDYPPYYSTIGAMAKYLMHETMHLLYGLCAGANVVPGGDYTHNHLYGEANTPIKPEDCFSDFDMAKLNNQLYG